MQAPIYSIVLLCLIIVKLRIITVISLNSSESTVVDYLSILLGATITLYFIKLPIQIVKHLFRKRKISEGLCRYNIYWEWQFCCSFKRYWRLCLPNMWYTGKWFESNYRYWRSSFTPICNQQKKKLLDFDACLLIPCKRKLRQQINITAYIGNMSTRAFLVVPLFFEWY